MAFAREVSPTRANVKAASTFTSLPGASARAAVTPCFAGATLPNSASRKAAFTCHSAAVSLGADCRIHRPPGEIPCLCQPSVIGFGIGLGRQQRVFVSGFACAPGDLLFHLRRIAPEESNVVHPPTEGSGIQ